MLLSAACLLLHVTSQAQRPTSSGKTRTTKATDDPNAAATGDKQNVFPEEGFAGIGILNPGLH